MNKKAMSHALYLVIALVVLLIVAIIVLTVAQDGIMSGGDKMITVIEDTIIPVPTS